MFVMNVTGIAAQASSHTQTVIPLHSSGCLQFEYFSHIRGFRLCELQLLFLIKCSAPLIF